MAEIDVLKAEEQLKLIEATTFGQLKEKDRRGCIDSYMKIVDSDYEQRQIRQSMLKLDGLKNKFGFKGKR